MWILVLTLFALRPSLQVYYSKTCGIMLRPDADVSLPRQSLLFSEDEELDRFRGKVDQAFERLRRTAVESLSSLYTDISRMEVKAFVLACVDLLQKHAVSAARKFNIARALNSLFVLAHTTLDVQDPSAYVSAFEHFGGAISNLRTQM